jgi:hypothetical protein
MTSWSYYWFLVSEASWIYVYLGPVTIILLALYAWALKVAFAKPGGRRVFVVVSAVAPAAVPALMFLIGVAFIKPGETGWPTGVTEPVPWVAGQNMALSVRLLQALWLFHLLLVALLAWLSRGGWSAAAASGLWWGWVAIGADFAARESVTGTWL